MMSNLVNALLPMAMWVISRKNRRVLLRATEKPEETQRQLLHSILANNAETDFGRDHSFENISEWKSFRENVPIQTYETLENYIKKQIENDDNSIVASKIVTLARTSGTSGAAKDIPTTFDSLEAIKDAQRQTALTLYQKTNFFDGKILAMFSSHVEGRQENGMAYGSSSGQANRNTSSLMKSKFAFPYELSAVTDYDLKYYLYALFGILQPSVTGIAAANPSSVCRIAEIIHERRSELGQDLSEGSIERFDQKVESSIITAFKNLCLANKIRAGEISKSLKSGNEINLSNYWPSLDAIVVWTGGSCSVALERLRKLVSEDVKFVELGYRASEFIGSVNLDAQQNTCVPTLHNTLFEFVEQSKWEAEQLEFTPISQLKVGENYYVIVTTLSGLYRYDINDVVQVTGYHNRCPTIQFLQKGKGVTSITGEKLYLHQVVDAIAQAQNFIGISLDSFLVLADEKVATYRIFLESSDANQEINTRFSQRFDECLQQKNIEYSDKRKSGRLKPPETHYLKTGAGEAIKRHAIKNGQRESQYKPPCLEYSSKFNFNLESWMDSR